MEQYITRREASKQLNVDYDTLYNMVNNNEIETIIIGKQFYNVNKYLREKELNNNVKRRKICYCPTFKSS